MLSLLTPWFLAGLGALSVPVLVHLVNKEQKTPVRFPSLMFLENVPLQSVRRQRLQHILLFILRCLALILLVLAFARPFVTSHNAAAAAFSGHGRDVVMAIDRSYSMEYGDRWKRAVSAAKDTVSRLQSGDRAAIIYFAGTASAASDLTQNKSALLAAIDSAHPSADMTRYASAIRLTQQIFGDTAQPNRELIVISDYQQSGWGSRELPRLSTGTKLTQVNVGSAATSDLAVTDVDTRRDTAQGRERVTVQVRLANHGAAPVVRRPVTFTLDGRVMQTIAVDCRASGVTSVSFDPVRIPPGSSRGLITAGPDSLMRNNTFYFAVTRNPTIPVLLVTPSDVPVKSSTFLTTALGISSHFSFTVRTVPGPQVKEQDLLGTRLVILNGASVPNGAVRNRLVTYVKNGGGLLMILGSESKSPQWSSLSGELLPRLGAVVDRTKDQGATFGYFDAKHEMFDPFNGPRSGSFSSIRYMRYVAMTPAPGDRQVARFDDGRLALLERRVGAGRVLVWSSDVNGAWNDFPVQSVFLPFVQEAAKYAAGYTEERPWVTVGEMLRLPALFGDGPLEDSSASVVNHSGAQYIGVSPSGVETRVTQNTVTAPASIELTESGFYTVSRVGGAGDSTQFVAVNVDRAESDLTRLDTALFTTMTKSVPTPVRQPETQTVRTQATSAALESRQRMWWYLLLVMLMVLGVETLLSNRLSLSRRR